MCIRVGVEGVDEVLLFLEVVWETLGSSSGVAALDSLDASGGGVGVFIGGELVTVGADAIHAEGNGVDLVEEEVESCGEVTQVLRSE